MKKRNINEREKWKTRKDEEKLFGKICEVNDLVKFNAKIFSYFLELELLRTDRKF